MLVTDVERRDLQRRDVIRRLEVQFVMLPTVMMVKGVCSYATREVQDVRCEI